MKIEYDYKPYERAKKAVYYGTGDEYVKDPVTGFLGWSKIEKEALVIGEAGESYVTELIKHRNCDTREADYGKLCLLPIGFHKSRLIKWVTKLGEQLVLFDKI